MDKVHGAFGTLFLIIFFYMCGWETGTAIAALIGACYCWGTEDA